jgi:hypothetical protein
MLNNTVTRTPGQVRQALETLEAERERTDPARQYQARRQALEAELAEAESSEKQAAYWELRASIEDRLRTYDAMVAQIDAAFEPILAMMAAARDLHLTIDDDFDRLSALTSDAKVGHGPPTRNPRHWPRWLEAQLRQAVRAGL